MKAGICCKDGCHHAGEEKLIPTSKKSSKEKTKVAHSNKNYLGNPFTLTWNSNMNNAVEEYIKRRMLDRDYIHEKCRTTQCSIIVPLYSIA